MVLQIEWVLRQMRPSNTTLGKPGIDPLMDVVSNAIMSKFYKKSLGTLSNAFAKSRRITSVCL